jgi:hypothetical protein
MTSNALILSIVTIALLLSLTTPVYLSTNVLDQNSPDIRVIKMSQIKISISVDDAHLSEIEKISQNLQSSGVNVEQTLPSIGIISGSIDPDLVNSLYQIEGVQKVEQQETYQLAPPSSHIQ